MTPGPPTCSVCGGELNGAGECTTCGTKHDANGRPIAHENRLEEAVQAFTRISGVGESKARVLYDHGFTTIDDLRAASVETLAKIPGVGERLAVTIHEVTGKLLAERGSTAPEAAVATTSGGDGTLQQWLKGGGDQGLNAWLGAPAPSGAKDESLRRWLTGEEDALGQWLGENRPATPAAAGSDREVLQNQRILEDRERELRTKDFELDGLRAELDSIKRTMSEDLQDLKAGSFDPMKYIEETARLNKELQVEIKQRRQLEEEIQHIKKGSLAVIKYVKSQQMKAPAGPQAQERLAVEGAEKRKIELELKQTREVLGALQKKVEAGFEKMKPDERTLRKRELAIDEKEAILKAKGEELATLEEAARRGELDFGGGGGSEELRSRMQEELREKEEEYGAKEEELRRRIISLEEEVNRFKIEERLRREAEALAGKPKGEVDQILARKESEILNKEKSVLIREQQIQALNMELTQTKDEMGRLKELVRTKDDELGRREEDLLYRERLVEADRRKLEHLKAQGLGSDEKDLKDRLEILKAEITQKEEEVRSKEKYLKAKMEELRLREQGLIEEEIEAREEDRALEVKQEKVHTGTARLDDLLLGGVPFGSNISLYGPAYVGKEVIANAFLAEGLKKGVPCLMIITDKTPADIRQEMEFVIPGFTEYERLGLVQWIDAYSRSMGNTEEEPHTLYVADPTDHEAILKAVDETAREWKKKYEYYRVVFRSISTLIAYLDPTTTFKFLQPFAGRRKRDKAVAMYLIEKGMHGEQEIQMLGSVMDGSVEIKVEQLKSYLCVKGISDVQSRAWIRYTYSKGSVNIGSFSLDHIR